ncbi:MAG: sugar transferase [Candidatus Dormibacteria bacterium]
MADDLTVASTLRDRTATSAVPFATSDDSAVTYGDIAVTTALVAAIGAPTAAERIARPVRAARMAIAGRTRRATRVNLRRWTVAVGVCDALAALLAATGVVVARLGLAADARYGLPLIAAAVPGWLVVITLAGGYDRRHLAAGFEYYRRAITAGVWVLAVASFTSFVLHADISRALVLGSVPGATVVTIAGRYAVRKALHVWLRRDRATHLVLAIGTPADVQQLVTHMSRASYAGFRVVGALTPSDALGAALPPDVAWAGSDVLDAIAKALLLRADTIAVVATHLLAPGQLRRLSWELEGTDIDLVLAPAITDVAGPRISSHPVAGLPLLCVEKPRFTGPRRVVKDALDRTLAAVALVALSPLLGAVALSVRVTSRGPVFFGQERVGLNGTCFRLVKFRSMRAGAHDELALLRDRNEHDGPLFKVRRDPRLTPIGAFLRRWSLDELPQLWNVITGHMSLVGPRPPLADEVERYGADVRRRLLVKPGMTGLWQVSGRSELSWEEAVRLDLYYVDNWSVGLDLVLLWKTLACVVRGQGAY